MSDNIVTFYKGNGISSWRNPSNEQIKKMEAAGWSRKIPNCHCTTCNCFFCHYGRPHRHPMWLLTPTTRKCTICGHTEQKSIVE